MNIEYDFTGKPETQGVYACRVEVSNDAFVEDKFLVWYKDTWFFPKSDQKFRGKVFGWIGPLSRNIR